MAICAECGAQLEEEKSVCTACGFDNTAEEAAEEVSAEAPKKEKMSPTAVNLIWSIINLVVFQNVYAVLALVFAIVPMNLSDVQAKAFNKVSRILNIISTAIGAYTFIILAFIFIIYFAFILVGVAVGILTASGLLIL